MRAESFPLYIERIAKDRIGRESQVSDGTFKGTRPRPLRVDMNSGAAKHFAR